MNNSTRFYGKIGEDAAAMYLEGNGYTILCRNYCVKGGEIDIVATKGKYLCFVEVKSRSIVSGERPMEAIDKRKRTRLCVAAERFLEEYRDNEYISALVSQFCVVEVYTDKCAKAVKIDLFTDTLY